MNEKTFYDVVVIGGGPAGLTAALYLARAKYRVVVVEAEAFGGQITITSEVVNYPGVEKTSGKALTETMRRQAASFGAEFLLARAERLDMEGEIKTVHTDKGALSCFGVLLATGAHPRMVGFDGEESFRGRGVAYCATCDGEFFTGKEVFVIGGGFAAAEEGMFLTRYATHVTIMLRRDTFSCAESVVEELKKNDKITVMPNTEVVSVSGENFLDKLVYRNNKTGEVTEYHAAPGDTFGVFVFAGYAPATDLVKGLARLDEAGYVLTDRSQKTSVEGLYAAGDVCVKSLRQVVTAVGDGALAATELERYAKSMQEKTGLRPRLPETEKKPEPAAPAAKAEPAAAQPAGGGLFSPDIQAQLNTVFGRMANPLVLKLSLDERPVSAELKAYMEAMAALTEKLSVEISGETKEFAPCVRVCRADGSETGLAFHGVPGGHEFTSFVLGLYNAAGPGQPIDETILQRIRSIAVEKDIMLLISLSCTMCPELVLAAQRIAAENPLVRAHVYDINHFPSLKEKYRVMSVPCMVIDNEQISFGKKNISQVLDLLGA